MCNGHTGWQVLRTGTNRRDSLQTSCLEQFHAPLTRVVAAAFGISNSSVRIRLSPSAKWNETKGRRSKQSVRSFPAYFVSFSVRHELLWRTNPAKCRARRHVATYQAQRRSCLLCEFVERRGRMLYNVLSAWQLKFIDSTNSSPGTNFRIFPLSGYIYYEKPVSCRLSLAFILNGARPVERETRRPRVNPIWSRS